MPKHLLKVPHHKQQKESDCLAACAAMLLTAQNIHLPYSQLLAVLDVAPWGTPHRNFRLLAEHMPHIQVTYRQGSLADLFQAIDQGHPVVVFVWTGELSYWQIETGHAVVIVGYDQHYFYLNDPAFDEASQIVTHGDLDLAWIAYDTYYALVERI